VDGAAESATALVEIVAVKMIARLQVAYRLEEVVQLQNVAPCRRAAESRSMDFGEVSDHYRNLSHSRCDYFSSPTMNQEVTTLAHHKGRELFHWVNIHSSALPS
jgi:hypothetical protein